MYLHRLLYKIDFHIFFFFKKKTAYEMRISDWSSDVCSSDLYDDRQDGGCDGVARWPQCRSQRHHHRAETRGRGEGAGREQGPARREEAHPRQDRKSVV